MSRRPVGEPFTNAGRREAARACAYGPRTAGDVARQLAKERGSVTTVLDQLEKDGVLLATTVTHSTGKAYELDEKWRPALEEAVESADPRGLLQPGLRLLVIGGRNGAALRNVVVEIAALPVLAWCARLDGPARLLVAARGETPADRDQLDRFEAVVASEGLDCLQLRIDQVLELADVDRYARHLTAATQPPAIPAGSESE